MSTPSLTTIPFAPYRLKQNDQKEWVVQDEPTLREVILHTYVHGAAAWLLGYQGNYPFDKQLQARNMPLRAQQLESPFETAHSILLLLETAELLGQSDPELTQEIYRKIPGAVSWLVKKGQEFAVNDKKQRTNWEDWYDTAIVTPSLLRAQQAGLIHSSRKSVSLAIKQALSWLADTAFQQLSFPYKTTLKVIDDLTLWGGEALAMVLSMMFYAWKVSPIDFIDIFGPNPDKNKLHPALSTLLDETIAFGRQVYENPASSASEPFSLSIRYEVQVTFADLLIENTTQKLKLPIDKVSSIKKLLIQGFEKLGTLVDTSMRADRLATYMKSLRALAGIVVEDNRSALILGQLRGIVTAVDPFGDGSTYHSLHGTWHTLRCLLEVCYWTGANRKVIELYDEQLKVSSMRAFEEQKEFYQLHLRLIDTEQQLENQQQQYSRLLEHHRWLRRGFIAIIAFMAMALLISWAMPILHFGHLNPDLRIEPGNGEGFITLIVTSAGLAGLVGYIVDRFLSRREQ